MTPTDRLLAAIQDIYATAVEVGEGRFEVDARRWAALAAALDAPTAPPAPPPATAPTADDATTVYTENYNRASGRGDSHEDAHEEALRALFDYAHDGGMADGARAERALAVAEDPQWDGTDAAHPAWWRGSDHAAKMMQRQLAERLGAPPDTCWQKLLDDVEARRAAAPAATAVGATDATPTERCFEQARAFFADMRERGAFVQEHGQDALTYHLALLLKRTEEAGARAERARCVARLRERATRPETCHANAVDALNDAADAIGREEHSPPFTNAASHCERCAIAAAAAGEE